MFEYALALLMAGSLAVGDTAEHHAESIVAIEPVVETSEEQCAI